MAKFSEVANVPSEDIEPPKPLPVGDYLCLIDGQPEFISGKSERTGDDYECYVVKCRPVTALETVDRDLLNIALEGLNGLQDVRPLEVRIFEPHVMHKMIEAAGINPGRKTQPELVAQLPGCQIQVHVTNTPGRRDKTQLFATIDDWCAPKH